MADHATAHLDSRYDAGLWVADLSIQGEVPASIAEVAFILLHVFPNIPPKADPDGFGGFMVRVPVDVGALVLGGTDYGWSTVVADPAHPQHEVIVSVFVPTYQ